LDGFNAKVDETMDFSNLRTVPGIAHGTASGAFLAPISRWAENDQSFSGQGIDVLVNSMDASILLFFPSANTNRLSLFGIVHKVTGLLIYT